MSPEPKKIFDHLPPPPEKTRKTSIDIKPTQHGKVLEELKKRGRTFAQLVDAAELQFLAECEIENKKKAKK